MRVFKNTLILISLLFFAASTNASPICIPLQQIVRDVAEELPKQASVKDIAFLTKCQQGQASSAEILEWVHARVQSGEFAIEMPEFWVKSIHASRPQPGELGIMKYGFQGKEIIAKPFVGKPGMPGGVHIFTPGEGTSGTRDFAEYLGPPHLHREVAHVTLVAKGEGSFILQRELNGKQVLVRVPVKRGTLVAIPPGVPHTFHGGTSEFDVISFSSNVVRTDSPAFMELVDAKAIEALPEVSFSVWSKANRASLMPQNIRKAYIEHASLVNKPLTPKLIRKYNSPTTFVYPFKAEELDRVKVLYHELPVSRLVHQLSNESTLELAILSKEAPQLIEYNSARNTVLSINPPYNSPAKVINLLQKGKLNTLKDEEGGLSLVAWHVHPAVKGSGTNRIVKDIEKQTQSHYLMSILDLTANDLPYLQELQTMTLNHLSKNYGVKAGEDQVRLYFHFPYANENASLHLQVRVNQATHGLELARSYDLGDVILYLRQGKSVKDLILDRQKQMGGYSLLTESSKDIVDRLKPGGMKQLPNPFYDPTIVVK